jgi:ABC-type tungstate transport system substrate-binding protein
VSLIAGDLAIFSLVAWLLLGSGKPLTTTEILFCVLAVVLGAWLTCLALYLD